MGSGKQLSINLISQIVTFVLNLCISFFLTPYVIEFIGKDVYGFVSLAYSFTSYVSVVTVALSGMLSRYVTIAVSKRDYQSASKYLSSVVIANCAIMLILLPFSVLFVAYLDRFVNLAAGFEVDIKILFLFVFVTFLVNLPGGCLNAATYAANRLDKSNLTTAISSFIRIALILGMLFLLHPHVWYIGFASCLSSLYIIWRNIHYKRIFLPEVHVTRRYFEWGIMWELISVGIWNSINQLTQVLMTGLDLIITNLFISVASMNLLSYAKMIPTQLLSLIAMIAGTFAPMMTLAYGKNDMKAFVRETDFAIKLCGFLCSIPIIGLLVFGEDFFTLWLRSLSIDEVHEVAILSALTILPQFFSVYIYPLYSVNTITTKLKIPVLVSTMIGIANVIIVFVLVNTTELGVYAVAGVSSVLALGRILLFAPTYAAHSIRQPLHVFYKPLLRGMLNSLVIGTAFGLIRYMSDFTGWFDFILVCAFAAVIGYILSFFIVFERDERRRLKEKVLRRIGGSIP